MNEKILKNAGVTLVLVILFSIVFVSLPTQRVMAAMSISINPQSGVVGDSVIVNGTIDTPDGNFTVRWNQTNIKTGRALGVNVNVSFAVPPTVGASSGRNVTIDLIDDTTSSIASVNFTLYTRFDMQVMTEPPPIQFWEGLSTHIFAQVTGGESNTIYTANLTVKNPANQTHFIVASLSNTTTLGSGSSFKTYPTDFVGAHTNYTGNYLVAFNETIATGEFFIGLTDKSEYLRNETVSIRATGYKASEVVNVDIKTGGSSVASFPKSWQATSGGVVALAWQIPVNATPGSYTLTITNTTSEGTVKIPKDVQNFEILGFLCQVQTQNLAGEAVAGVWVEVYNVTLPNEALQNGDTNSTGWILFNLNSGYYTFRAFVKDAEVGVQENQNVTMDTTLTIRLRLVNVAATVETETGVKVPFVDIALKYNYTTRDNETISETASMQTNHTGMAEVRNLFTNTAYRVEAKRYNMLFSNTTFTIGFPPVFSAWINLDLTLPTYRLNVHALDSKSKAADGVQMKVYEWASGVTTALQSSETNQSGDVSFSLPFGRYRLRGYKDDAFLNETVINLFENPLAFTFYLTTVNVDVTVSAFDYFGQPVTNAEVKIERKVGQEYVLVESKLTGSGGSADFALLVGGDSRISVYVAGRLVAVKAQFLGAGSNQVTFYIGEYVSILGYPIETGLLALVSFIFVSAVVILILARRHWMKALGKRVKR